MPEGSVLVAHRLLPSDAVFFTTRRPAAVIVESGSPASHCALMGREMGIPGVVQLPGIVDRVTEESLILVDGLRGHVVVEPDKKARRTFERERAQYTATLEEARTHSHDPAVTRDGIEIPVMANIGSLEDAKLAVSRGADGVGLYRTEMLFTSRRMLPTEDELFDEMDRVLSALNGKPVSVRLLDLGGDKNLPYLDFGSEPNPFLGRRGVRLLLRFPKLLDVQLRVLLRLSQNHNIRIMIPMVTLPEDVEAVRETLTAIAEDMGNEPMHALVSMIETPAAALSVSDIMESADFVSVGTNDLTQYTMAAGRDNPFVAGYFRDDHPAIRQILRTIVQGAGRTPVAVCGELAGRLQNTEALLRTGVRVLSVAPPIIPSVKQSIRKAVVSGN
jgi:phosphoenolpyruvate-protein kinase (PTS system EI component)